MGDKRENEKEPRATVERLVDLPVKTDRGAWIDAEVGATGKAGAINRRFVGANHLIRLKNGLHMEQKWEIM